MNCLYHCQDLSCCFSFYYGCKEETEMVHKSPIQSHTVSKLVQFVFTAVCLTKVSELKLCNSSKYVQLASLASL